MNRLTQHILTASLAVFLLASGLVAPAMSLSMDGISTSANFAYATEHDVERYQFLAPIGGLGDSTADGGRDIDVSSKDSLPNFAKSLITLTIGFAIMAAIVLLVIAGFRYMTTVKDGAKSDAKKSIGRAIGGLVLALAAVVILQTINPQLIELQGIEPVTVDGGDFAKVDPALRTEFRGRAYAQGSEDFGSQFCFHVDGTARLRDFFWEGDEDRYICYDNQIECEVGEGDAKIQVGDKVEEDCRFWYEASGVVQQTVDWDGNTKKDKIRITRIDRDRDDDGILTFFGALDECRNELELLTNGEIYIPKPGVGVDIKSREVMNACLNREDKAICEVVEECSITQEKPIALAKDWNRAVACSTEQFAVGKTPVGGEEMCWDNLSACEVGIEGTDADGCYLHPTFMAKGGNSNFETSCELCVVLDGSSYKIRDYGICSPADDGDDFCRINAFLSTSLRGLDDKLTKKEVNYLITEAFPPTVKHSSECHYDGTCVDVGLRKPSGNGYTKFNSSQEHADAISAFIEAAGSDSSIRVVYEVPTDEVRLELIEKGVPADSIIKVKNSAGVGVAPHFSVYDQ